MCAGASLTVRSLHVRNDGWQLDQLSDAVLKSASCPEVLRIRGYTLRKNGGRTIAVTQPGAWLVEEGVLSLDEEGGAAADGGGRRGSSVGGAILGEVPPPPNGTWSSSSLSLAPGSTMRVPLVLGAPSRVTLEVRPLRAPACNPMCPTTPGAPPVTPPPPPPAPSPSPSPHASSRWSRGGEACTSRCCLNSDLPCYHPSTYHPRPRHRHTAARAAAARRAVLAAAAAAAAVAAVRLP